MANIAFLITDIVLSANYPDPTQTKLNYIVQGIAEINATTYQTLDRVVDLQVNKRICVTITKCLTPSPKIQANVAQIHKTLQSISQQLELILVEIQQTECYVSTTNINGVWSNSLQKLWYRYIIGKATMP